MSNASFNTLLMKVKEKLMSVVSLYGIDPEWKCQQKTDKKISPVSRIYTSSSTANGRDFLISLLLAFPFRVNAVQTDNGHEFLLHFHKECVKRGIAHFFSRPRTPTDNTMVERIIQTSEYELWLLDETIIHDTKYLNSRISAWF